MGVGLRASVLVGVMLRAAVLVAVMLRASVLVGVMLRASMLVGMMLRAATLVAVGHLGAIGQYVCVHATTVVDRYVGGIRAATGSAHGSYLNCLDHKLVAGNQSQAGSFFTGANRDQAVHINSLVTLLALAEPWDFFDLERRLAQQGLLAAYAKTKAQGIEFDPSESPDFEHHAFDRLALGVAFAGGDNTLGQA